MSRIIPSDILGLSVLGVGNYDSHDDVAVTSDGDTIIVPDDGDQPLLGAKILGTGAKIGDHIHHDDDYDHHHHSLLGVDVLNFDGHHHHDGDDDFFPRDEPHHHHDGSLVDVGVLGVGADVGHSRYDDGYHHPPLVSGGILGIGAGVGHSRYDDDYHHDGPVLGGSILGVGQALVIRDTTMIIIITTDLCLEAVSW